MYKSEERVFIKGIKVKGVVKEVNEKDKKYKVTFFNKNNKRVTAWFPLNQLRKFMPYKMKGIRKSQIQMVREEASEPNVKRPKSLREIPVKIKRLHPDAVIPKYATELAAGFDLVAVEDVVIAPGETKLISLGFAVEIPEGFEMQVRPRSGVTLKTKLRVGNSPGTIDADFRGEVKVIVDNISRSYDESTRDKCVAGSYIIRKGDRIAQGVIAPVYRADFIIVDHLGETERGDGGFGSTGN